MANPEQAGRKPKRGQREGSVYQRRDGVWVGRIMLGRKANGKPDRPKLTGPTKADVQRQLAELIHRGPLDRLHQPRLGQFVPVSFERGQSGTSVADVPLSKVPGAGLEYIRRLRELKYREALFELLIKQYEVARIDESKDAAIIQVVDKAVKPEIQLRDWLIRSLIGIVIVVLALIAAVVAVFVMEAVERAKEDSQYAAHLQLFRFYLSAKGKTGDVGVVGPGERS